MRWRIISDKAVVRDFFDLPLNCLNWFSVSLLRIRYFIGFVLLLGLEKSEAAIQANCTATSLFRQKDGQEYELEACLPDIKEVNDKDFTIFNSGNLNFTALALKGQKAVKFLPIKLFHAFSDLILFDVTYCSVASVDANHFKSLSKLKFLILYNNVIENIASDAFVDLVSLEVINLVNNRIQSLDEKTFTSLEALNDINLRRNKIRSLDPEIFESLTNLKNIDLDFNELERIPKNLFKNNLKLETVWFANNKIKLVNASMFNHLPNLRYVGFGDNICIDNFYGHGRWKGLKELKDDLQQNCVDDEVPIEQNGATNEASSIWIFFSVLSIFFVQI